MASKNREGETWLVDKRIDHRKSGKGRYEFQVRWVGDYEDTWEPRANIPEELVSRYFARGARRSEEAKRRGLRKEGAKLKRAHIICPWEHSPIQSEKQNEEQLLPSKLEEEIGGIPPRRDKTSSPCRS